MESDKVVRRHRYFGLCSVSSYLLHQIENRLGDPWPSNSMTLYADDAHCAWNLESASDLTFFIRSAVAVLEVYQEYGMKINTEKSALIIRLVGTPWCQVAEAAHSSA